MSGQRASIKSEAKDWRGNLRKNCIEKTRQRRQEWLNVRRVKGAELAKEQVTCEVHRLVQQQLQQSWAGANQASQSPPLDPDLVETLIRDLYEELVEAELKQLEEQEAAVMQALAEGADEREEMERMAQAAGFHVEGQPRVLCPVCSRAYLVQLHGFITCPLDKFQLDVRTECMNLEHVRQALENVHQVHHASGCKGSLGFSVADWLRPKCLLAVCNSCELMQVVV